MANGINAVVHDVQATTAHAVVDCLRAEAEPQQLPTSDNAVLGARQLGDDPVQSTRLKSASTMEVDFNLVRHCPIVTGEDARVGYKCDGCVKTGA
jgi:hypothetical protein